MITKPLHTWSWKILCCCFITCLFTQTSMAQHGADNGNWTTYGGDLGNSRYSALTQITEDNFAELEIAWHFSTENLGPRPEYNYESTPLVHDGVLYSTGGSRKAVYALNAATGELLWVYSLDEGSRGAYSPRRLSGRGLSFWTDGITTQIMYVTQGYQLVALNAATGRPVDNFGNNGIVDLKLEFDQELDLETAPVGLHAAPTVVEDVIIIGAAHAGGSNPKSKTNIKGYVRGYNVRTGERLWIFHTIPMPGEFGYDTWLDNSADYTGNTGVWTQIAVDPELGLAYLPVEEPTGDYYGGTRPGNNLFGESLVAIDYKTGERRWHYQIVHHPIWDYDVSGPPILVDAVKDGKVIKAVAQTTKQTYVYVFDRATGEPVFPIEERPFPAGNVPGEWYAATQPIPSIAVGRERITVDDLIDFTPELRAAALESIENYELGHLYTAPVLSDASGTLAALLPMGGTNWPGGAYDPESQLMFVPASGNVRTMSLIPQPGGDMPYGSGIASNQVVSQGNVEGPPADRISVPGVPFSTQMDVNGLPLLKPPYGTITAVDMKSGEIVWQVAHGDTPDSITNHPDLQGIDIPRTGREGFVAPVVTSTLLVLGEPSFGPTPSGQRGAMLRAYNKSTGAEVGAVFMPAPQSGSPITYMVDGRQYITLPISGASYPGAMISYRLPDPTMPSSLALSRQPQAGNMEHSVWEGVYSEAQAAQGAELYAATCSACHGSALQGIEMAPALSGLTFMDNWNRQSLLSLSQRIRSMPPESPGLISASDANKVLSYLLQAAGFPSGQDELSMNAGLLSDIEFERFQAQ